MVDFNAYQLLANTGQLAVSAILGGLIGYEREMQGRPAGLRTHILVAVGATLFTLASLQIAVGSGNGGDPGRIAAQIVSGIGFLGAGTIIRQGNAVRGLTTAASLWAVAGVGMLVGAGGQKELLAVVATFVILLTLTIVKHTEDYFDKRRFHRELTLLVSNPAGVLHQAIHTLEENHFHIRQANLEGSVGVGQSAFHIVLQQTGSADIGTVTGLLAEIPQVISVEWT